MSDAAKMVEQLTQKVTDAFNIFDHESNKTVDVREIGTIVRSLGCCPTEAELHDLLAEMEEEEPTGFIKFEKFFPEMTKILMQRKFKPATSDKLVRAFEVLDEEGQGFLTPELLTKYMTKMGEPFTDDEMDEFLTAALDPEQEVILYKDYASVMVPELED